MTNGVRPPFRIGAGYVLIEKQMAKMTPLERGGKCFWCVQAEDPPPAWPPLDGQETLFHKWISVDPPPDCETFGNVFGRHLLKFIANLCYGCEVEVTFRITFEQTIEWNFAKNCHKKFTQAKEIILWKYGLQIVVNLWKLCEFFQNLTPPWKEGENFGRIMLPNGKWPPRRGGWIEARMATENDPP